MACYKKCHVCEGKRKTEDGAECYMCEGTGKLENCDMKYVYEGIRLWSRVPDWMSKYRCTKCGRIEYRSEA